jgi:serine/threonine-protein kinase
VTSEVSLGLDPRASIEKANHHLDEAIRSNPNDDRAFNERGVLFDELATYQYKTGLDPGLAIGKAEEAYKASLAIVMREDGLYNLTLLHVLQVDQALHYGGDPTATLASALVLAQEVIAIAADSHTNQGLPGRVYQAQAEYEIATGEDPQASCDRALEANRRALAVNPRYSEALSRMAHIYWLLGRRAFEQGRSPGPMIEEASRWMERSRESSPDNPPLMVQARVALLQGRWRMAQGLSPEEAFARSRNVFEKALAQHPIDPDTHAALAEVEWRLAQWQRRQGHAAVQTVARGLGTVASALAVNPRNARAIAIRGALYLEQAHLEAVNGRALQAKARESLDQAVAINRFLAREYGPSIEEAHRSTRDGR